MINFSFIRIDDFWAGSFLKKIKTLVFIFLLFGFVEKVNGQVVINEIGIAPTSGDTGGGGEFIELFNQGNTCVDLSCWVLMCSSTSGTGAATGWTITIPSGKQIKPGQCFLIGGGGNTATPGSSWNNSTIGGNAWNNTYGPSGSNIADVQINSTFNSGFNNIRPGNFNNTNGQINLLKPSGASFIAEDKINWSRNTTQGNNSGSYTGCKTNTLNGCTFFNIPTQPNSTLISTNNLSGILRGISGWSFSNSLTPGRPNPNNLTSTASTPTFSNFGIPSASICLSSAPANLPSTSNEGWSGTWSPASINTTATTPIVYTFTPSNCVNPFYLTITPAPSAGTLNGVQNICTSGGTSTATFTSTVSGGTWSSSNSAVASINSTSGVISPLSAGTATMTYTVTGTGGCSNATATRIITVTSAPTAGLLAGTQTICFNETTTFTSTVAGGAWTSGNTSIATINSLTGAIAVVSAGATTMTYTVTGTGGCSNATLNRTLTINPIPNPFPFISDVTPAPSSSAPINTVCSGSAVTLSTIKPDSVFYNRTTVSIPDNGLLATPPPPYTSLISLQSANYRGSNISINFPSGYNPIIDATTLPIINVKISHLRPKDLRIYLVRKTPLVANDDIIIPLCLNRNLTNNTLNNFDSTIFSMSASVPIGNGSPPFAGSYIPEQSFNSFIGKPIAGDWYIRIADNVLNGTASSVLQYWSIKFGETDTNIYNWSNGSNTISTVVSPTTTTNYTLQVINTFGCSSQSSITVNVTQPPNTGNLTGDQNVCVGSTTNFTSDVSGGTWSSPSGSTIASVSSSGVVFGLSQGTETMTYTVPGTGGCSSSTATRTVTVTAAPNAGNISGTNAICSNGSTILNSNGDIGGIWSSNNTAVATINSTTGAVLPVASGSAIITYTVNGTGGCSDVSSSPFNLTVNDNPTVNVSSSSTCVGGSATVTANTLGTGPYSYNWTVPSGATNPDNVGQFSTNVSGPYSVVVTNTTTGCSSIQATDTVRFTTPQPPSLSGGSSLCLTNTNFSLEPSILGGTFNSSNPSIASINNSGNITPISAGATTITYTIGSGACQGTATQSITIIAPPDAGSLSGVQNICSNGTSTFVSTGASSAGSWSSGNESIATINASGIITPVSTAINGTVTMTYTVAGTGGCADAIETRDVTITTLPNAGILSGDQSICANATSTFISTGASDQGVWSSSNTSVASIDATTGVITPASAGIATMTYTVAGTGGCSNATSTRTVTVTAAPNAGFISGPSTVCLNGSATLSSSGSGGSWSSNNTNSAIINPTTGVITPVANGTATISYTVVGTGGCSDVTSSTDVSVIAPPNASIVNNTGTNVITCAQPSIDVIASGGNTYSWSSGLGTNANQSITSPGNYTVTVTGTNGCTSTASINLTQNISTPTAAIINNTGTYILTCTQTTISLTATGGSSYSWNNGLGTNATVTIGSAGTYIVTATGTNGCTSSTQVVVTASAGIPTPTINNLSGGTELNCVRSTINVSATGGTSYSWSNGIGNNANATITQPGTYTVTVTGSNGCSATAQITITRDVSAPNATIQNNSNTAELTCIQTSIALTANGGGNYSWSNSLGTSSSVNITNPGDYTVTVTGTNGCISTASVSITRDITSPNTTIINNTGTVALTCTQTSISLTATGGESYSWNNGLGTNANVLVTSAGTYIVTATGTNGCASTAQVTITASSGLPTAVISNTTGTTELNCTNNTINLTATGGVSYIWSNGLGTNANVVVTNPGTYSVTVTASNGCSATADIQITENFLLPAAAITNNSVTTVLTCAQPTINLTAAGGVGYAWNNGLGNVASVVIGAAGNYVVTVTGTNGCSSTAQIDITASSDLPVASIQNNTGQTILDCNTTQINLQAQGGGTYSWSNGLGNNQTVNILSPGTYTVTVTGSNGCSASTQVNITQDITPPNIVIINNSNSTVLNCNHPTISLSATGGATYNWNQGLGNSPDVTIVTPGNYSVSVSGNNGCLSDAQIDIIQGQTSAVASSFTASACGTYNLPWGEIASSSGDYIHTYTTIQGCDSIVTATISIVPGAGVSTSFAATSCSSYALPWGDVVTVGSAYTHTYTSSQGCDSIVTANITIDIPIEPLFSPVAVCIGSNYQLPFTSDNGVTGSWSPAFDNTASATYQFIPDAGQCAVSTSLDVVVNPNDPEPLFTPVDRICVGTNFVLPAVSNNGIAGSWTPAFNNTNTTTYSFTPTAGQCPVIAEMLVVVNPLPQGNFTASQSSICEGDSVQLNATAADNYQWYFNNNLLPGAVGSNYFATQEGAYTVEYVSDSGCRAMATQVATLSLTRKPDVIFAAQSTCPGKPLTFNSESDVSASLPVTYNWNFGNGQISNQQQVVTTYAVGGSYNVTLTVTPDACPQLVDSITRTVLVYEPRAGIRYNAIDAVVHEPVNLLARAPGRSYLWTPSTGLNSDNIRNPVLDPTREITFTIRISDLNGCETVDTQFVRIHNKTDIQVPQVFTPNGDGNNDMLYPFIIGIKTLKYFRVYNRWGNLLFESNDWNASKGWNGTLRGKPQPAETYIWVAEGTDVEGKLIKKGGNVILVR